MLAPMDRPRARSFLLLLPLAFCGRSHSFLTSTITLLSVAPRRFLRSHRRFTSSLRSSSSSTVAIVGSGAVGCYYGARLWEQGHDVHFLFRGANYKEVQEKGLTIRSIHGDLFLPPPGDKEGHNNTVQIFNDTRGGIGRTFDWVIVALKSSALDAVPSLILPLLDPEKTRVLVIMNGLVEEDLLKMLKEESNQSDSDDSLQCCRALYGGMAFVCSNRIGPAEIDHTFAGLLSAGVASTRSTDELEDERAFRDLLAKNVVDIDYEESLLRGRWKKMIWNLPFNGISVAMGGITVDQIVGDPGLRRLAFAVMDETIAVANADLESMYGKNNFRPLGEEEKEFMMSLSDNMGAYKTSTMLDFLERRSLEVKYLFERPVERAKRLCVSTPHLDTLVVQIAAFQRMHQLF